MQVAQRTERDPILDWPLADAYMRFALLALEEVAGEHGVQVILRQAGLAHLIGNYPPNRMEFHGLTYADYANLHRAIIEFYGRAARAFGLRIGRLAARRSIEEQSALFGVAVKALRLMPLSMQLKTALTNMANGLTQLLRQGGYTTTIEVEERDDAFVLTWPHCPNCAGLVADRPICWIIEGGILEATHFATGGKAFAVHQIACRATGDPACSWQVPKTPTGG